VHCPSDRGHQQSASELMRNRDPQPVQALLRQLGLSIVLGGADGTGGQAINSLLGSAYSRNAEREADDYSIRAMEQGNISPKPTAGFFQRLSKLDGSENTKQKGGSITGYMSSHPLSSERKKAFEDSLEKGRQYHPILNQPEWQSLKSMCDQDKDVEEGFGLF